MNRLLFGTRTPPISPAPVKAPIAQLAVLLAAATLLASSPTANAASYQVPSMPYPTIQSAVAALPVPPIALDTILVAAGTYRELVPGLKVQNKQRSATYPLLLKASGTVVIEGSEEPVWQTSCSGPNGTVWIGTLGAPLSSPYDSDLVFVNGTPYAYNGTECGPQSLGQYGYESATHTIFINLGPGMPPPDVHVRVRDYGIAVLSTDHVTIDGFTFLHSRGPGIQIQGTSAAQKLTSVAASNSVASGNSRQGIFLKYATSCTVVANTASYNGRHGIHLTQSDHCSVLRNRSYGNDWLLRPGIKGNSAGIKLGDGPSATDVTDITVDYNATFSNEDTGIDIRGGTGILLRRNVSYSNGDHGYDHNPGVSVTHLNNVSAHNAHDGISIPGGHPNSSTCGHPKLRHLS